MVEEVSTKPAPKVPRGIRQSNPGNIRHGQHWQGLATEQPDKDFCRFISPVWGIRAICRILLTYYNGNPPARPPIRTVRGIINRWAPPVENDTEAYVRAVAASCAVDPDDPITVTRPEVMRALVKAIIRHENGQQPYDDATIDEAMKKAGVRVP